MGTACLIRSMALQSVGRGFVVESPMRNVFYVLALISKLAVSAGAAEGGTPQIRFLKFDVGLFDVWLQVDLRGPLIRSYAC